MTVNQRKYDLANVQEITSPEQLEEVVVQRNLSLLYYALKHIQFNYKDLYSYLNDRLLSDMVVENSRAAILGSLMEVSESTAYRWKNSLTIVKAAHADRLSHLIELYTYGVEVLGSDEAFKNWLNQPNIHFKSEPPITRLDSLAGIKLIRHLLDKIEYGAPV